MSEQPGRYQRSAAGMVGAMVVLVLVVGAFVLLRDVNRTTPVSPVRTVDYHQSLTYARENATFDLVAPDSLPAGWRATSVTFDVRGQQRWHLGVLTDRGLYIGLEQGPGSVRSMVTTYVDPEPSRSDPVTIEGKTWSAWSDSGGDRALVRRQRGTTTLIVGPVPQHVLVDYVTTLR